MYEVVDPANVLLQFDEFLCVLELGYDAAQGSEYLGNGCQARLTVRVVTLIDGVVSHKFYSRQTE